MKITLAFLALGGALLSAPAAAQPTGSGPPAIVSQAQFDGAKDLHFAALATPAKLYVGQQATYEIGIFLSEALRARLRSNPQFVPPDVRSVMAYDLPVPRALFHRTEGGRPYDVHVFSRALFPLTAGTIVVPPARLTYALPLSNSIFAREETRSATSAAQRLTVIDPPSATRPAEYAGAVGSLSARSRVDASAVRMGDPVLFTLTVSGVGNVALFPRPPLALPWAHTVVGSERVRIDSSSRVIAGAKEFDWVVTPRIAGTHEVPAIRYAYFNPYTERYEFAVTSPIALAATTATMAALEARKDSVTHLVLRREYRGPLPGPFAQHPVFWAGLAVIPVPALVRRLRRRRQRSISQANERNLTILHHAERLSGRELRKRARELAMSRVPLLRNEGSFERVRFVRLLRRAGVSVDAANEASRVFGQLDAAAFDANTAPEPHLAKSLVAVLQRIDDEALPVGHGLMSRARALTLLGAFAASATGALATVADADARLFQAGVAAYESGEVQVASQAFAELALRHPRAPDVWANRGTVAWTASDTVGAVTGWQRALRLEPRANDVRQRLRLTSTFQDGLLGDVPPVSPNALALVGALCWLALWFTPFVRSQALGRTAARAALVGCALVGLAALWLADRLEGKRDVLVASASLLHEAPSTEGGRMSAVRAGETARERLAQGAWSKVRFADGREGWIESNRLVSLRVPATD